MTDQDVWVIKYGDFEARIDVSQLGQLPLANVRKLLKLSRMADNPESLESFGPLLERAKAKKPQDIIRGELTKDQKRAIARLDKIKYIYEKEFKNYVY
ncbi:MAG: hypothetical protein ACI4MJ_07955 [Aristaeellaceae bacterium]